MKLFSTLVIGLVMFQNIASADPVARPRVSISAFHDLFAYPADWSHTRGRIDSVISADHGLNRNYTDDQLQAMFEQLRSWNLSLDLEVGAIKEWGPTGQRCFDAEAPMWNRFLKLGAPLKLIAMDEPLTCVRNSLKKPDDYAVQETADFIARVRSAYPSLRVGDIETFPTISVADHIKWIDALNARLASLGVRGLDFYRLDVNWVVFSIYGNGSWRDVRSIEQACRSKGIPFSLIYWASNYPALNGRHAAADDTWYVGLFTQANDYLLLGGAPDEVVIESWIGAPKKIVPENGDFTFTRSVRDFLARFVDKTSPGTAADAPSN